MKIILLATVPHTGTWFMVEFFRSHPAVSNFIEVQVLQKAPNLMADADSGRKGLISGDVNLVQGHFGYPAHEKLLLAFAAMNPLVIPLRDPLLSLITAVNRDRSKEPNPLPSPTKAWLRFVEKVDAERDFYQPFYVPLDLMGDKKYKISGPKHPEILWRAGPRLTKLMQVQSVAGLHDIDKINRPSFKNAEKWAEEWPHDRHNSRGMYPLKEAYLAGDTKKIRDAMPKAYYFLEQAEDALRPMLEREGYRELMWWT